MSETAFRGRDRLLLFGGWLLSTFGAATSVAVASAWQGSWLNPWWLVPVMLGIAWHRWMYQPEGVPVLMYHSVSADRAWLPWGNEISVSPETFDRHLFRLAEWGLEVISTATLLDARRSGEKLPRNAVVLHLDDGYLDNWVAAAPLLRRHGCCATVFVSLDFIEPGDEPRPTLEDRDSGRASEDEIEWAGYLNWAELELLARTGPLDVQAHGRDHARVEVGPRVETTLSERNWKRLAWVQWERMPGPKWDWYRHATPPAVPFGTQVRVSAPSLSSRRWSAEGLESQAAYDARVESELLDCRETLEQRLGTRVDIFCWPQLAYSERGRELAARAGYRATATGAVAENRADDDPTLISRVYVGERNLGFRCRWVDDLALRAAVRVGQGNRYWLLALVPIRLIGRAVRGLRSGTIGR